MITFCENVVTSAAVDAAAIAPRDHITKPLSSRRSTRVKPPLIDSIEWLVGHLKPQREDKSKYLTRIKESLPILNLYREFFPDEWRSSSKSPFATSKDSACYSEREVEFFHLVNERVVTLGIDWYLDWEERCPYIPLMTACDWDYCHGEEFVHFSHAFQLAFALNRVDDGSAFEWYCQHYSLDLERFVLLGANDGEDDTRPQERKLDFPLFKELCKVGDTPLQYLPLAIEITCYDTGNPLFDFSPEMETPDIPWTTANLRMLEREQIAAESLSRQVAELTEWLDAGDRALRERRIERAVTLWNLSYSSSDDEQTTKEAARETAFREARRMMHHAAETDSTQQLTLFDRTPRQRRGATLHE